MIPNARLTLIALLALLLPTSYLLWGDTTEDPLAQALVAFGAGEYEKAIEFAETIKKGSSNEARAKYLIGEAYLVQGSLSDAETGFRAVLALKPKAVPALVGLGRSLAGQGKRDEARTQYEAALKIDKKDAGALRALGELQMAESEDQKQALKTLKAARKAAPKDPQTARALVEAYLRSGDDKGVDKKAESIARKQIKATPKHPMGHFLQGIILERRKKDDDAIGSYQRALALDDTFIDAHKNLAILCLTNNPTYQDKKRTDLSMKHFERYFALGGEDPALEQNYRQIKGYLDQQGR